jgi:glycosyltransferase involved in cell wall biosynthesis
MVNLSICIPTYEYHGKGVQYLSELFSSLRSQSYQDFEVVISDHSINNEIFEFCETQSDLEITYLRNPNDRGNQGANTNCAMNNAEGRIIKVMYQDDLFFGKDSLQKIIDAFNDGAKWLMSGFTHMTEDTKVIFRSMVPKWTDEMIIGRNLLGSPSCFAVLNEHKEQMDENLRLLIDADLYYRLGKKLGKPTIIEDILIINREHTDRISSNINYDMQIQHPEGGWLMNRREFDYVTEKYNLRFN